MDKHTENWFDALRNTVQQLPGHVVATAAATGALAAYFSLNRKNVDEIHGYKPSCFVSDAWKTISGHVETTEQHGGQLVARVLKAHGVEFIFTLVGGHISPILAGCEAHKIRVVDVRHEVNAVFAADAVARLTGLPGVAAVTAGPGVTNTITAVKNAQMAETPLVLIGGAAATLTQGRGALQDIDQMSLFKPLCKFTASVKRVCDIVPTLRKAFQMACSGVPGPVFIEFPIDVLYPINEIRANLGLLKRTTARQVIGDKTQHDLIVLPKEASGTPVEQYLKEGPSNRPIFLKPTSQRYPLPVQLYLQHSVQHLFANAFATTDVSPLKVSVPLPSARDVSTTIRLLKNAKRPVIILQSQALLQRPTSAQQLRRACESLGIPCFLGGMARGLLGRDNPLHIRQNRRGALKEADVVILAGALVDFRLDYGRVFSRKSKVIAVNRSAKNLKQNTDAFWTAERAIMADPATFIVQLADAMDDAKLDNKAIWGDWAANLKSKDAIKDDSNLKKAQEQALGRGELKGKKLINPLKLCFELDRVLPENAILIGDGGDFVATASYTARPQGPLTWLDPGAFGTLGVGAGFALGAKLVCPEAEVWILWGDGSVGYSIAEFDTFKRHNTPVIALVGNDACWTQIERDQVPILNTSVACPLLYTPYEDVARGYGGEGEVLQTPDDDITAALHRAQRSAASGVSYLVNARIGKTNFREGSISV